MKKGKFLLITASCLLLLAVDNVMAAGLPDYTDKLVPQSGLVIVYPVYGGRDASGRLLGDYEYTAIIRGTAPSNFSFDWSMTYPARAAGHRVVLAADLANSRKVSVFMQNGENGPRAGYSDIIQISSAIYRDLKAGKKSSLEFDGGLVPKSIMKVVEEDLTALVNEQRVQLHAIKAKTENGWLFWVLDNPRFPILLKGAASWNWDVPTFSYPSSEAQNVLRQFTENHEATTHAILFAFDSAEIQPASLPVLEAVGELLKSHPQLNLEIQGHTDNLGPAEHNLQLAKQRAESVRNYLLRNGGAGHELVAKGYGAEVPVASNETAQGRAQNRRVVFKEIPAK